MDFCLIEGEAFEIGVATREGLGLYATSSVYHTEA
jgi:hypothetical protein